MSHFHQCVDILLDEILPAFLVLRMGIQTGMISRTGL